MKFFRFCYFAILMIFVLLNTNLVSADSYTNTIEVFKKSPAVQPFLKNAYGYAVFPTVGKGGFGIGGAYGKGKVFHKGMAVFVHVKGGLMYEAAIGGQKFSFKPNK